MTTNNLDQFRIYLENHEQYFLIDYLRKSTRYLVENRNDGGAGAWGFGKGSKTDINLSALSVEAIRLANDLEFQNKLENSLVFLKNYIDENLNLFDEEQLAASLNIILNASPREKGLEEKIISKLENFRKEKGWGSPTPSLTTSCKVLLSLIRVVEPSKELIQSGIDILTRFQNIDGGWGSTLNSASSIVPSCYALQLNNLIKNINTNSDLKLNEMRTKGIGFFSDYLTHLGSDGIDSIEDNYIVAIVLRSIAEMEEIKDRFKEDSINALKKRMNSDYGWGIEKGRPSNIENTALSIIALIVAGENKFISMNLVLSKLNEVSERISILEENLKIYETDKNNLVLKESGNIKADRDRLFNRCEEFEVKIKDLEKKIKEKDNEITECNNTILKQNNRSKEMDNKVTEQGIRISQQDNKIKELELKINEYLKEKEQLLSSIRSKWYNSEYVQYFLIGVAFILLLVIVYYIVSYAYINIYSYLKSNPSSILDYIRLIIIKINNNLFELITIFVLIIQVEILRILRNRSYFNHVFDLPELFKRNPRFQESPDELRISYQIADLLRNLPPSKRELFFSIMLNPSDFSDVKEDYLIKSLTENEEEANVIRYILASLNELPRSSQKKLIYDVQEMVYWK